MLSEEVEDGGKLLKLKGEYSEYTEEEGVHARMASAGNDGQEPALVPL